MTNSRAKKTTTKEHGKKTKKPERHGENAVRGPGQSQEHANITALSVALLEVNAESAWSYG